MILYNNWPVTFGQFPNGESYLRKLAIDSEDINHIVTLKYEHDSDLFHLLLVRKELINLPVSLRILYTPYSRMDRESDVYTFSLKVFTDFINSMYWDEVIIFEPHSDVLPALLDRVRVIDVATTPRIFSKVNILFDTEYQICYPDVGAFKRYSDKLKIADPLIGFKIRDFKTGKILSLKIEGTRNQDNAVIVDDLCSKGGTFIMAAKSLREMGFKKVGLVVAHCENTIYSGEVFSSGLIDKVITTDSILDSTTKNAIEYLFPKKLEVIPISVFR